MPLEIRRVQVWCGEIANLLGAAATKLEHLARTGTDLQFVFTRPHPSKPEAGVIFLGPIFGQEAMKAAREAGLAAALDIVMLYIQGPNRPGMGFEIMSHLAVAGIPLQSLSISAAGDRFGAYLAFNHPDDVTRAVQVLATIDS
jgi:hypothetical protein